MTVCESQPRAWSLEEVVALFKVPFNDLLYQAHTVFRSCWMRNTVQMCHLVNIKSGRCPENCGYCAQSAHHKVPDLDVYDNVTPETVQQAAQRMKKEGVTRLCLGGAWRKVSDRQIRYLQTLIRAAKAEEMEVCGTFGMATEAQLLSLKESGLDYYNHNINTSREYHPNVVSTHTYDDRLETVRHVRRAGLKVCCGVIIGMGETQQDRASMLAELSRFKHPPESVPINRLIAIPGTRFENKPEICDLDFVRTIAVARIVLCRSYIRLSAGRHAMSKVLQSLCFFAGANSFFYGEKLLTASNAQEKDDQQLLEELAITKQLST